MRKEGLSFPLPRAYMPKINHEATGQLANPLNSVDIYLAVASSIV